MAFTTVGEIMDVLSQFERSTPVVKSDPTGLNYFQISLTEQMVFLIAAADSAHGHDCYRDAKPEDPQVFEVISL